MAWIGFAFVVDSSDAAPSAGSRISWQGQDWYLHGPNMPWYNWACDFGCAEGGGVVSTADTLSARLSQVEGQSVRWWVFPGDPWQVDTDGIDERVYRDLDAAVALASKHDLTYQFVLFSAPSAVPSSWLTNALQRQQVADALGQVFARYADESRVMSWEVFNEPEFDIWNGKVAEADVRAFTAAVVDSVHRNSNALATVGSAMLDGLPIWKGIGLDFYSAHWYDYMSPGNWCAMCTTYKDVKQTYGLDAPLVIGEYYLGTDIDAEARLEQWYQKGYAGAFSWSLFGERTHDGMTVDLEASAAFAEAHADAGPRLSGAPAASPTPGATQSPTPTATPSATATPAPTESPTPTPSPTASPTPAVTATPSPTPSPTPVATATPSATPSPTATVAPAEDESPRQLRRVRTWWWWSIWRR